MAEKKAKAESVVTKDGSRQCAFRISIADYDRLQYLFEQEGFTTVSQGIRKLTKDYLKKHSV